MQGLSVWRAALLMLEFKEEVRTWEVQRGNLTGKEN